MACPAGRAHHHACRVATSRDASLQSEAERFVEALSNTDEESGTDASHAEVARLQDKLEACQQQVGICLQIPPACFKFLHLHVLRALLECHSCLHHCFARGAVAVCG